MTLQAHGTGLRPRVNTALSPRYLSLSPSCYHLPEWSGTLKSCPSSLRIPSRPFGIRSGDLVQTDSHPTERREHENLPASPPTFLRPQFSADSAFPEPAGRPGSTQVCSGEWHVSPGGQQNKREHVRL